MVAKGGAVLRMPGSLETGISDFGQGPVSGYLLGLCVHTLLGIDGDVLVSEIKVL